MEALSHDPNKLKAPEVKERLEELSHLILGYQSSVMNIYDAEKSLASGFRNKDRLRSISSQMEQAAVRGVAETFVELKSDIADTIGEDPIFRFEFEDHLGDVTKFGSHSLDKDAKVFLADRVEAQVMGIVRLSNQHEDSFMTIPRGTSFRIELES